jgi:hypothetical protein
VLEARLTEGERPSNSPWTLGHVANWKPGARKLASSSTVCCLMTLSFLNSPERTVTSKLVWYREDQEFFSKLRDHGQGPQ